MSLSEISAERSWPRVAARVPSLPREGPTPGHTGGHSGPRDISWPAVRRNSTGSTARALQVFPNDDSRQTKRVRNGFVQKVESLDWSHRGIVALLSGAGLLVSAPVVDENQPYRRLAVDDRSPASSDGALFIAVAGTQYDSHRSLGRLAGLGYSAAVGEKSPPAGYTLPYYQVTSSARALACLAQAWHGFPGRALRVLGITGTNGKSTTVRILAGILEAAGRSSGWLGTVSSRLGGAESQSAMTTPPALELAASMDEFRRSGGQDLVLEVSSHALDQSRVGGIPFQAATFTNLSRDHYDYHGGAEPYLESKLQLLDSLSPEAPVIAPWDAGFPRDRFEGRNVLWFHAGDKTGEGTAAGDRPSGPSDPSPVVEAPPTVRWAAFAREIEMDTQGIRGDIELWGERVEIESPLLGRHNLANILAAALTAKAIGVDRASIQRGLRDTAAVPGRMEAVSESPPVFVDYAHTPDALDALLSSLKGLGAHTVTVVFGCGGDRDRGKRAEMGRIAERLAERVIVTSDNPRGESPEKIIDDVLSGVEDRARVGRSILREVDRRKAIELALALGSKFGDDSPKHAPGLVVVAGKGHERTQEIAGRKIPFDDSRVIREILRNDARDGRSA